MKIIKSKDNRLIKAALKLKQRKYRDTNQMFLVEGERAVRELINCRERLHYIMVDENRWDDYESLMSLFPECEPMMVEHKIMDQISSTDTPQGIAAVVGKNIPSAAYWGQPGQFLIYLDNISDPGNLGTMIRSALAFNVDGIMLSPGCTDPYSPKVVRSAMGAIMRIQMAEAVEYSFLNRLKAGGFKVIGSAPEAEISYYELDFSGSVVLALGSEAHGLSQAVRDICEIVSAIPVGNAVESLNVAIAASIMSSEAYRQRLLK